MKRFIILFLISTSVFAQGAKADKSFDELHRRKTEAMPTVSSEFTKEEITQKKRETLSPTKEKYSINEGDIIFTDTIRTLKGNKSRDVAIQATGQKFIRETQRRSRDGEIETMILSYKQQNISNAKNNNKPRENYTENTELQISIPFTVSNVNNITKDMKVKSDDKKIVYYEIVLSSSNERIHNLNDKKNSVVNAKIRDVRLANATYLAIINEQQIEIVQLKEEIKYKDEVISDLKAGRQARERTPREPKEVKEPRVKHDDDNLIHPFVAVLRMPNPFLISVWGLSNVMILLENGGFGPDYRNARHRYWDVVRTREIYGGLHY